MYRRETYNTLVTRILEPRRFIQVLSGPRQTGKTTIARQVLKSADALSHYASADEPTLKGLTWIEQQWEVARAKAMSADKTKKALLVLDEIHKIPGWSETVKRLWDEDSADGPELHVVLLGSSPLLGKQGLTESLAGRFETIPVRHWSFSEMQSAFGWNLEQYIFYGGYPGSAALIDDEERWGHYIRESLIETTISRDVLLVSRVHKPALLRRVFEFGCTYSGQILSYQKMLGQLHDAGNTTTLAHYLDLLSGAGMVTGLQKYAGQHVRRRASSPKLLALDTALMAAQARLTMEATRGRTNIWGRFVESAVGAHLANTASDKGIGLFYWSAGNCEVDFVLARGKALTAIEVKSGAREDKLPGMEAFCSQFEVQRKLLVGARGIPLDDFLKMPVEEWL